MARVLKGVEATAAAVGLGPIKINLVLKRGINEDSVLPMARYFHGTGYIVRFIEYMDVGASNDWRLDDIVPAPRGRRHDRRGDAARAVDPNYRGEVANRYRYQDGGGEIGIIASVTQPFCADCTRARISAEGKLYTCLFAAKGHDLRALVRGAASDDEVADAIASLWRVRDDRYSKIRSSETAGLEKIEMSYIGG